MVRRLLESRLLNKTGVKRMGYKFPEKVERLIKLCESKKTCEGCIMENVCEELGLYPVYWEIEEG